MHTNNREGKRVNEDGYPHIHLQVYKGGSVVDTLKQVVKKLGRWQQEGVPVPYYVGVHYEGKKEIHVYTTSTFSYEIQELKPFLEQEPEPATVIHYTTEEEWRLFLGNLGEDCSHVYHKVNITPLNILGWAKTYYRLNPDGTTEGFIGGSGDQKGEIREPVVLADYINPYKELGNLEFSHVLDLLNPTGHKKDLGTFYTPLEYAELAKRLVYNAIRKHQDSGNRDYIILDRCAGTGHLEQQLNDGVPDDIRDKDVLGHVILNTYSYTEYLLLVERFGDRVLYINPPESDFVTGEVKSLGSRTDALAYDFVMNPVIQGYLDDPQTTVILLENPPYGAPTSVEHQKRGKTKQASTWRQNFLVTEMKKEEGLGKSLTLDMVNVFIWSAFKYYLRQPSDSYIVIAPIKYYKVGNLANKVFQGGYGCNRKHFNTNINSFLLMASWGQEDDLYTDEIVVGAYDCKPKSGTLVYEGDVTIKKARHTLQKYYDLRVCEGDVPARDIQGYNGRPSKNTVKVARGIITNPNIIANLIISGFDFNNPDLDSGLVRVSHYGKKGFYLREDNFIEKLPVYAASRYVRYNNDWKQRGLIYKTGDGFNKVEEDLHTEQYQEFLKQCLIFTCLDSQNHIFSFYGIGGHYYRNELCLDDTQGDTLATAYLKTKQLSKQEDELVSLWQEVLTLAKQSSGYKEGLTYGLYQIQEECNHKNTGELTKAIQAIKPKLKEYYNQNIVPKLCEYSYLK